MRGPLQESTSFFLIRLSPSVLVPIGLFRRTQSARFYLSGDSKSSQLSFQRIFEDYQSLLSCRDYQFHPPLLFKDYRSHLSCRDNQGHPLLYFSKTIRVFSLEETINVIRLYFSKTIIVFCLAETIKVICSFIFQRLS